MKFKLPSEALNSQVVLLKPLVQAGVASRAFSHLGPGDLLQMVRWEKRWKLTQIFLDFPGVFTVFQGFSAFF